MLTLAMSPGEQIKSEPGAMVSMQGCEMATGSSGGFLKGLKKMALGGESFFLNTFTAGPLGVGSPSLQADPVTSKPTTSRPDGNCSSKVDPTWRPPWR